MNDPLSYTVGDESPYDRALLAEELEGTMKWEDKTHVKPARRFEMDIGGISLSISESSAEEGVYRQWQSYIMSGGVHTDRPFSECQEKWPREALQRIREAVDRAEKELDE